MAKAGGLADVVGALPKYLQQAGHTSGVVMPMHRTNYLYTHTWDTMHRGTIFLGEKSMDYTIIMQKSSELGFPLYCVDIFGLLDRDRIYGYEDDSFRFLAFQMAVLEWLMNWEKKPDVLHVHDHHTALIPFLSRHCSRYSLLNRIPIVLTIHNAQYQGQMGWEQAVLLPYWNPAARGLLDWNDCINPLAAGIKCADRVTTVSEGYLEELMGNANGLEGLIRNERFKCKGIINGIDSEVWNPATDLFIPFHYSLKEADKGKRLNKEKLCAELDLDAKLPLFCFIGRMVSDKSADLLPELMQKALHLFSEKMNFIILGSGHVDIENSFRNMAPSPHIRLEFGYKEAFSHLLYASSDFLLMPSRVEPCGLNQLYAMRYGTIPIVRKTGGLKDTVKDMGDAGGGTGITVYHASMEDLLQALHRSLQLFKEKEILSHLRKHIMSCDFSWQTKAEQYIDIYESVVN
jgi:starch synthase